MKAFASLILLICVFMIRGQEKKGFVNTNQSSSNIEEGSSIRTFDDRYAGVDGHPYLFDDFITIRCSTTSNEQIALHGNVDLLKKVIIMSQSLNELSVASMKGFKADGVSWEIVNNDGEILITSVLYAGNDFDIIKSYEKILKKAQYSGAYASGRTQDSFKAKNRYFIHKPSHVKKISISYHSISEIFKLPKKDVKSVIKKSYLNIKNEEHYDEIFMLFN